jgi:hypothetical protein
MKSLAEFKMHWDAKAILTPAEKARLKVHKEFGAYTRAVARNSMIDVGKATPARLSRAGAILSYGMRVSRPGTPAFSVTGLLKRHIYFASTHEETVVGPAKLSGVASRNAVERLEYGGTERVTLRQFINGKMVRREVTGHYEARPTMRLAFAKALQAKLPKLIENGIMREAN